MKKYIYILILFLFTTQAQTHTSHYEGIKVINMEIFKGGKKIGYSNFFFEHKKNKVEVKNYTQFEVKLFGVVVFSISSEAHEKYKDGKLIYFKSITFQNDKEKYVNLKYNKLKNKFVINGSSFKGEINTENLAILGHSSGGHLALLAGARSELLVMEPDLIVGLAAISDVVNYAAGSNTCQTATPLFMGGNVSDRAQEYFNANPSNHGLHKNTVLLQGDIDEIVPLSQATLPGARTIISIGASHFDWAHPDTLAYRRLLELLDENF